MHSLCRSTIFFAVLSVMFPLFCSSLKAESPYEYLDRLATESGADKASYGHNYTKVYAKLFDGIKDDPLKLLEIGVCAGASVKLWERYLPNADLYFIDIDLSNISFRPSRSQLFQADQSKADELLAVMNTTGGQFDIILDDGGHTMDQQIISFKTLFPFLKSGGVYIIEDLHTSYWSWFGGGGNLNSPSTSPSSTVEFLKQLIDDVNFVGARTAKANHDKNLDHIRQELTSYREEILSMTFYDSLCFITKR